MYRFYFPQLRSSSKKLTIDDKDEVHHITNVLRLKKGSTISLFNGEGAHALVTIETMDKEKVGVTVQSVQSSDKKGPRIVLACAIPKKSKFETIIEKATEFGVDEVIPMITKRTEVVLKGDRLAKKNSRYETVALNAAKQSKRTTVPLIHAPRKFSDVLEFLNGNADIIIPSLSGQPKKLLTVLNKLGQSRQIAFLIGPEGDFTPDEYATAQNKGAVAVSLGPTVLKVETAALCAISCAQLTFSN